MYYYVIEFFLIMIVTYFFYYKFFMQRNNKRRKKPVEFAYLEARYLVRLEKVNINVLSKVVSLCNALIIATTVVAIDAIDNMMLQLLIGFALLIGLIVLVYYFIGLYYKKKGMTRRCTISQV